MTEEKSGETFLGQLLDEVNQTNDNSDELNEIGENLNMEGVLSVLSQANDSPLSGFGTDRFKRQRRGNRMKVYDNGYIFTYDKDSSCGQRSFWRCERKNECPARVHTNPFTNQIIKRIHGHSHEPPNTDDLPPWALVKNEESNTPPPGVCSHTASVSPPDTRVLFPSPVTLTPSAPARLNPSQPTEQVAEEKPSVAAAAQPEENVAEPPRKRARKPRSKEAPADVVSVKGAIPATSDGILGVFRSH
ncbi:FLYWCH zinc finger domain protein [Cooperia oncophora]